MSHDDPSVESFEDFRRSFSYGSRNNLDFKFLKSLPDHEAAEFLRVLLDRISDAYDSGDLAPILEAAIAAQQRGYAPLPDAPPASHTYGDGPFQPTARPVNGSVIGLVASSGHFLEGDDPKPFGVEDMSQDEAIARIGDFLKETPILSEIPSMPSPNQVRVRHGGYNVRSAAIDPDVAFPRHRLSEAAAEGRIGAVTDTFFSFPGATAQGRLRDILPAWLDRFAREEADAFLLVPL